MGDINSVEETQTMIRFVYPNVNERDQFIGCGRYLTTVPEDLTSGETYTLADPQANRLSSIRSAAHIFAPESDEADREVYEKKDSPSPYLGNSLGLAYLLALIQRSRQTRWEEQKLSGDIWCTGTIDIVGGHPQLGEVFPNQFAIKLKAFFDDPHDKLFVLPLVNLKLSLKKACKEQHVRLVTFSQFKTIPEQDLFSTKTVLQLHGYELQEFVAFLFQFSKEQEQPKLLQAPEEIRLQNLRNFTVQIRIAGTEIIAGTGIVVSTDGKIFTCGSVVQSAIGCHPCQASDAEVDVYFPQLSGDDPKTRQAKVAAYLPQHEDDIVLLQLSDEGPPLAQEQIAVLGDAEHSKGNSFETYGYLPSTDSPVTRSGGMILGSIETLPTQKLLFERVQLQSDHVGQELNGAAVLDKTRNLVIGLLSKHYLPKHGGKGGRAYAINLAVLTADPFAGFDLSLQEAPLPKGIISQPEPQKREPAATDLGTAWNNAPTPLKTWVGRKSLISNIINDWTNPECRITGLIGFGGEGKSSLARKVVDELLSPSQEEETEFSLPGTPGVHNLDFAGGVGTPGVHNLDFAGGVSRPKHGEIEDFAAKPRFCTPKKSFSMRRKRPNGIFWWGFYTRPSIDEFFEAALTYMSGGRIDPAMLSSASERAKVIGAMLHSGHYLFILDGLEPMQHQQGDRYGLLKNEDLRQFLSYFSAAGSQSFCLITSRVPVLDLMEYTSYTHRDVIQLSKNDGRVLLRAIGVRGDDEGLDQVIADWGGHALTLSLLGAYLVEHCDGDVKRIAEIPSPTAKETRYERVNRVLRRYDSHLSKVERAFLMIFSVFRIPVDKTAFDKVFRAKTKNSGLWKSIAALNTRSFKAMLNRLTAYRILNYDPAADYYMAHPLIIAHYRECLNQEELAQIQQIHHTIKEYYLSIAGQMPETPTLEELAPLMEAVHHACRAGEYDDAYLILRKRIDLDDRYVVSDELGAWDTYLRIMLEFFPDGDAFQEPQVSASRYKGTILHEVGYCFMLLGHLREAVPFYKRAIEMKQTVPENWVSVCISYQNLMEVSTQIGELKASADAAHQALILVRRTKNKEEERNALADQAWSAHLLGKLELAGKTFRQADALSQKISEPKKPQVYSLHIIRHADHLRRIGDKEKARQLLEANLAECKRKNWQDYESLSHLVLGDLDADAGKQDSARTHYNETLRIIRSIARRDILIDGLCSRGRWFARHKHDTVSAFNDLNEALDDAVNNGYRIYEADIRIALAWAYFVKASAPRISSENRNAALANAWTQADRAQRMSQKMGYYWGQVDAEEVMRKLEEVEEEENDRHYNELGKRTN